MSNILDKAAKKYNKQIALHFVKRGARGVVTLILLAAILSLPLGIIWRVVTYLFNIGFNLF